jgi:hypothetical protein
MLVMMIVTIMVTIIMMFVMVFIVMDDNRMFDDHMSTMMTAMMMNMNRSPDLHV